MRRKVTAGRILHSIARYVQNLLVSRSNGYMASWWLYIIDDLGEHCHTYHPDLPATSGADANIDLEVTSLHEIHVEQIAISSYKHLDYAVIYENAFRKHTQKAMWTPCPSTDQLAGWYTKPSSLMEKLFKR